MAKRLVSTLMISILLAMGVGSIGCGNKKKVKVDPTTGQAIEQTQAEAAAEQAQEALRSLQGATERVLAYADLGKASIAEVKASELLKGFPELDEAVDAAEKAIEEFLATAVPLHELSLTLTSLDLASKEQLRHAFEASREAMNRLLPQAQKLAKLIGQVLTRRGIKHVDLDALARRVGFLYSFISTGMRVIESRLGR